MELNDYVSLNVAKRLKEKGFDEPVLSQYTKVGSVWSCQEPKDFNKAIDCYSRPTLYEAQKWLRTKHNIHVCVDNNASGWFYVLFKADNGTYIGDYDDIGPNDGGCWDSYEDALNDGIMNALNFY